MNFCEKCPAPHQCQKERQCCWTGFVEARQDLAASRAKTLQIPKDVLDEAIDAMESAMCATAGVNDPLFRKLSAAEIALDDAMTDAEATEP